MAATTAASAELNPASSNSFTSAQDEASVKPLLELVDQVTVVNDICSLPLLLSKLRGLLTLSYPGIAFTQAVTKDNVSFGRSHTDIILAFPIISEREADLKINEDGRASLTVHSKNQACYINSSPVSNGAYELQDGACMQFASSVVCWYEASERNLGHCLTKAYAETNRADDTFNLSQLEDVKSILSNPNTPAALSDKSNLINTHSSFQNKILPDFSSPFKSPLPRPSLEVCANLPSQSRGLKRARPDDLHDGNSENYDPMEVEAVIKRQKLYDGSPSKVTDVSPIHSPHKLVKAKTTSAGKRRRLYSSPFQQRGHAAPPLSVPRSFGMPSPLGFPPKDASLVPPSPEKSVIPPTWDPTPCKSDSLEQRSRSSSRASPLIPSPELRPYVHIATPRPSAAESNRQSFALNPNYRDLLENAAMEESVIGKSRNEHLRMNQEFAQATQANASNTTDRLSSSSDVSMLDTSALAAEIAASLEPESQIPPKAESETPEVVNPALLSQVATPTRTLLPSAFPLSPVRLDPTLSHSAPRAARTSTPSTKTMPRPSRTSPRKGAENREERFSPSKYRNAVQCSFLPVKQYPEERASSYAEANASNPSDCLAQDFLEFKRPEDRTGSEALQKEASLGRLSDPLTATPKSQILSPQPFLLEEPGTPSKSSPIKSPIVASPARKLVPMLNVSPSKTASPLRRAVAANHLVSPFRKLSPLKNVVDVGLPEVSAILSRTPLVPISENTGLEPVIDAVVHESPLAKETPTQVSQNGVLLGKEASVDNNEVPANLAEIAIHISSPLHKVTEPVVEDHGEEQAEVSETLPARATRKSSKRPAKADAEPEPSPKMSKSVRETRSVKPAKDNGDVTAKPRTRATNLEKVGPAQTKRGQKAIDQVEDRVNDATSTVALRTRTKASTAAKEKTKPKRSAKEVDQVAPLPVAREEVVAPRTKRSTRTKEDIAPVKEVAAPKTKRLARTKEETVSAKEAAAPKTKRSARTKEEAAPVEEAAAPKTKRSATEADAKEPAQSKAKRARTTVKADKEPAKGSAGRSKPASKARESFREVEGATRRSSRVTNNRR